MSDAQGGDGGKPSDAVGDSSIGPFGDKVNEKFNVGDAVEMLVHDGVFAKVSSGVGTEREPQPCSFRRLPCPALPSAPPHPHPILYLFHPQQPPPRNRASRDHSRDHGSHMDIIGRYD